jgi:hypothetical protein
MPRLHLGPPVALTLAAIIAHGRDAPTQPIPPPRVVRVTPRAAAPSLPSPVFGWTAEQLRARPWLAGQTPPRTMPHEPLLAHPAHDPRIDEGPFAARLTAIARDYLAWGRVDDELRWAPYLCRQPNPSRPRLSATTSGGHAQKVYFLYARDRFPYVQGAAAARQVVVKESWTHRPVPIARAAQVHASPLVARTPDGTTVEPDRAAGLFVMMRVAESDPASDRGWVYGTVSPAGDVTSVGRVASCMGCHEEAGPGRLFGLRGDREH